MEKATFGAGCFWGVEAKFKAISGVLSTQVGYSGGALADPSYEDVCTGNTGHAEVVTLEFDPAKISYEALLDTFWGSHNPTTLNQQGVDFGTQYRSVIFFHTPEQEKLARTSLEKAQKNFKNPIVTEILPSQTFYRAEEYHQCYLEKNKRGSKIFGNFT